MTYRDDFERLAHDVINVVKGGSWSGSAPQWQIEKVADMLRAGPGVTVWPRTAAEAAQAARDRVLRRAAPPVVRVPTYGKKITGIIVDELPKVKLPPFVLKLPPPPVSKKP